MPDAIFFRLLSEAVEDKPAALEAQLAALNASEDVGEVFTVANSSFAQIPSSPLAYWVGQGILAIFASVPQFEGSSRISRLGLTTLDDTRFLRLWYEAQPKYLESVWVGFAKGGSYSPYFSDVSLVFDWEEQGVRLRDYLRNERNEVPSRRIRSEEHYFRPGLTWPRRTTSGISFRPMPSGCIFADKGPAMFVAMNDEKELLELLALTNSALFESLVKLQLGAAAAAARSYEVGIIESTPIPEKRDDRLVELAHHAHDLQREKSLPDETTHVFQLPALVAVPSESLAEASAALAAQANTRQDELAQVQAQIDDIVFDLYGLDESDRQVVRREMGTAILSEDVVVDEDDPEETEEAAPSNDLPSQAQNLLMWCMGVAFGRWDVRKALDPSLFSPLPEPFDPLPRCAPGALMNSEGLPAEPTELPADYPLPIAWDGVLIDDPAQESNPQSRDIVARVRAVLTLLWGEQADAIERELCAVLGVRDLRDYFRHPSKGFFNFHIKRYSKSRRKAPIYWLLQSERRNGAVWLYYPRLVENTLFVTENTVYDLLNRERNRLEEFKGNLEMYSGAERKRREREIDRQTRLVAEFEAFHKGVLRLANQNLPPDHNDGVLISIAPLHELVPWREAATMWQKLLCGEYSWSGMSEQMRVRGMLKSAGH